MTDATFEIWATREGFQQWSRIFDFGPNDSNFFTAVSSVNWDPVLSAVQWKEQDFETGDFTITDGDEVNLAVTISASAGGTSTVTLFQDGLEQRSFVVNATLADLVSDKNWLGRSKIPADATADASYNEFRIYNRALSSAELLVSSQLGPDQLTAGGEAWGMDLGDFEQAAQLPITILGGAGNDFLFGTPTRDVIDGGSGNDVIVGGAGNDQLNGAAGNDTIYGNSAGAPDPYPYFAQAAAQGAPELVIYDLASPYTYTSISTRPGADLNDAIAVTVPVNVPADPIAYYSFDGNDGANSVIGNPNVTATDVTFGTSGISGNAAAFTGQSSVLTIGGSGIDAGADWTAAAWFKGMVDSANHNTLFHATDHPVIVQADTTNLGMWDNTTGRTGDDRFRDSGFDLAPPTPRMRGNTLWLLGRTTRPNFISTAHWSVCRIQKRLGLFQRIGNISSDQQFAALIDEVYIYDRALTGGEVHDLYDSVSITTREVNQITNVEANAFGLQGSANDKIETLESFGDVNGDGLEDFIARGTSKSYLLFGPVELTDLEDIETYAEIVIDHETLGRPAEGMGDINADGIRDYAFVTSTRDNLVVRIVLGTVEANQRNWNGDYWTNQRAGKSTLDRFASCLSRHG